MSKHLCNPRLRLARPHLELLVELLVDRRLWRRNGLLRRCLVTGYHADQSPLVMFTNPDKKKAKTSEIPGCGLVPLLLVPGIFKLRFAVLW